MIYLILFLTLLIFLISFGVNYVRYLGRLKRNYKTEWQELLNKDPFVGGMGVETRWLHGPVAPLISIFNIKKDYGDSEIKAFKKRAIAQAVIILACFVLFVVMVALSNR
jgi:hypothetical protein